MTDAVRVVGDRLGKRLENAGLIVSPRAGTEATCGIATRKMREGVTWTTAVASEVGR